MQTGSFEWALDMLKQGYWVRADGWSRWGLYLHAETVPGDRFPGKKVIFLHTIEGEKLLWRSRPHDEQAATWTQVTHADLCAMLTEPDADLYWVNTPPRGRRV